MTTNYFRILMKLLYALFLFLAIYTIITADTLQTYISKVTSFTESSEPISELPTIVTSIDSQQRADYKYGEHFNISYHGYRADARTNLTFGENAISGSPLKVYFEAVINGNIFKVTPINFSPGMPTSYILDYIFENTTGSPKVSLRLSSEANFISLGGVDIDPFFSVAVSEVKMLTVFPEKYVYMKSLGKCQDQFESYNELWLRKTAEKVKLNCSSPCQLRNYGKRWNKIFFDLPFCHDPESKDCYKRNFEDAKPDVASNPCTRMQYRVVDTTHTHMTKKEHQATYELSFTNPPTVKVKHEYLIYDGVDLLGVTGGILGIFVGISIYGLSGVLLKFLVRGLNLTKINKKKSSKKEENYKLKIKRKHETIRDDVRNC